MSELLQIVFQKGVDQSIDARVAPTEIHAIAENVRWRKDGRPAKRYGSVEVEVNTFADPYFLLRVNAIANWNQIPVLALGSGVRAQTALGWTGSPIGDSELSHFSPGERQPIAYGVNQAQTVGFHSTAARTILLYAWQSGGATRYLVRDSTGAVIRPENGDSIQYAEPRCVSTTNFIYLLKKQGVNLILDTFDPVTCAFTGSIAAGTLGAVTDHFDACGRGSELVISYQSAAAVITTKSFSAVAVPVLLQTRTTAIAAAGSRIGVAGTATGSNVFVAINEAGTGQIKVEVFNAALTASLGVVAVETDPGNDSQPGVSIRNNAIADIVWGGRVPATDIAYTRVVTLSAAGTTSTIGRYFGISPASKPFGGPLDLSIFSEGYPSFDGTYVWVETSNSSPKWDTQRAYLLVKLTQNIPGDTPPAYSQLSVPDMPSSYLSRFLLGDVLPLGFSRGFIVPLINDRTQGSAVALASGVEAITFQSIFDSVRSAARDAVIAGRALQFSGGSLREFLGELSQTGFCNAPVIQSIVAAGAGGLSAGTYLYKAVYEYIDDQGRRHRSAPSDPFSFVAAAASSATLTLRVVVATSHFPGRASGHLFSRIGIHVYRSLVGQGTYHRVTGGNGALGWTAFPAAVATSTFTDSIDDLTAGAQEFLYTEGGVLPNALPPPCEFMTLCAGRLWLAGQLDRTVVTASKLLIDGEPTQFSADPAFAVSLPEKCTGIASIDGTVVAFAREKIFLIAGDGPNDQGIGEFRPPTELPTDIGCIDWRSVVETSIGILFQGKRGIYLLPRGFGTPVFIGAPVEATLAQFPIITSATLVVEPSNGGSDTTEPVLGEITARFIASSTEANAASACLTLDLRTGGWSIDRRALSPNDPYSLGGTWLDRFVYTTSSAGGNFGRLRAETVGAYNDGPSSASTLIFIRSMLGTVDVRPFGVGGYGGFDRVVVVGEYRGNAIVTVLVSVDGRTPDQFSFTVIAADAPDGSVYLDVTPRNRLGTAIRVTVSDGPSDEVTPTEGFLLQALFIEHELIGKTKRLAEARKG